MEDPLRLGPYQRCESNLVVDSDIALLFVLRCDAHFAKFLQASPTKPSQASPTAYQRRYKLARAQTEMMTKGQV